MSTDLGDLEEPTRTCAQAALQEMDENEELKRLGVETTVVGVIGYIIGVVTDGHA